MQRNIRWLGALLWLTVGAVRLDAQTRPLPPPPDTLRERVLREVKAPAGFDLSVFAAPPNLVYPACVEAAPTGEVFACVEPNLNFDRVKGRGRIVRLVDGDGDGVADRYSVFADSMDSPRGLVYDGGTLYVMHAPTLSAMRDTDGDGAADERRVLVSGLGFGLDDRGGDHTSNGLTLGMDGWLYLAVGDYGFVDATGSDGRRLQLRGGGVVRVRPDGSGMEIVARGTRNIYDVALDPFGRVFARDNNNNGQGWGVRLHFLPEGANVGWPALFRDFPEDALAPLADYGAGAGTSALWIHDPGFPRELDDALYTADWGLNRVFRHRLQARGASFAVEQEEFLGIPRPSDLVMDGRSNLYVASLSGGAFNYSGEHVGYIVRLRPTGVPNVPFPALATLDPARLVAMLGAPGAVHRLAAQRELLRRDRGTGRRLLERMVLDPAAPGYARVAAMFTLKQQLGPGAHPLLLRAARDPAVRAPALRALTDRRGETSGVPRDRLVDALGDPDAAVVLEAVNALRRMGARGAAGELLRVAAGTDAVLAHVAVDALVELEGHAVALAALDDADEAMRAAALRVLQRVHAPDVVAGLIERVRRTADADRRGALLQALARLHHRDAPWTGDWWDVLPSTDGPYHDPATWSESERILPVLEEALLAAEGASFPALVRDYSRNRVIPKGADSLLLVLEREDDSRSARAIVALVGTHELDAAAVPLLAELAAAGAARSAGVARLLAAQSTPAEESVPLLRNAALDAALAPGLRVQALSALGRLPAARGVTVAAEAYARLTAEISATPPLEQAWRRFAGERRNGAEIGHFLERTRIGDAGERVLGYAVLVQIARTGAHPRDLRDRAAAAIETAWTEDAAAGSLVRAIELMNATALYPDRLSRYRAAHPAR